MTKSRVPVPRAAKDSVLREYNHRCAVCGADRPQLHHIDEDPSNNDPLNLIPLCPNCHLNDQHDPTKSMDVGKLKLFREYKDPTILKPQFHPLYVRLQFFSIVEEDSQSDELEKKAQELTDFIAALEMGTFYSKQIGELVKRPRNAWAFTGRPGEREEMSRTQQRLDKEYREQLKKAYLEVVPLTVELLRFQKW